MSAAIYLCLPYLYSIAHAYAGGCSTRRMQAPYAGGCSTRRMHNCRSSGGAADTCQRAVLLSAVDALEPHQILHATKHTAVPGQLAPAAGSSHWGLQSHGDNYRTTVLPYYRTTVLRYHRHRHLRRTLPPGAQDTTHRSRGSGPAGSTPGPIWGCCRRHCSCAADRCSSIASS